MVVERASGKTYGAALEALVSGPLGLRDSVLDVFKASSVEPMYAYLDQETRYGPAHIVQLGWYWPF